MSFAIGQRWISETENSLGLGMITALDFRSVTLHFPASDETRIYSVAQAPLTRIALNKGEQLHHQTWNYLNYNQYIRCGKICHQPWHQIPQCFAFPQNFHWRRS